MVGNVKKNTLSPDQRGGGNSNRRGAELERTVQDYLDEHHIQYQYSRNNGIDFIINLPDWKRGLIHMDCIATGKGGGSIGEKLIHKLMKYIRKYNLKDIFILHPNSFVNKSIQDSIKELENWKKCNIHMMGMDDFYNLIKGTYKLTPQQLGRANSGFSGRVILDKKASQRFFELPK